MRPTCPACEYGTLKILRSDDHNLQFTDQAINPLIKSPQADYGYQLGYITLSLYHHITCNKCASTWPQPKTWIYT